MPSLTVTSRFFNQQILFTRTPTDPELQIFTDLVLGELARYLDKTNVFDWFVKMLLFDGPNVNIQNPSVRDRYQRTIAFEKQKNIVVPIIVVNKMDTSFMPCSENTIYIVVDDPSKSIDDAVIGMILETIGRKISFFPRLIQVGICSSDFKLINSYDDIGCMSNPDGNFGPTSQARKSIFCGAVSLRAKTGPDLRIFFLIPDDHQNRIPQPDYGSVVHPEVLLESHMMEIDSQHKEQMRRQRRIDDLIRNLFLGMFGQMVVHKNGCVSEIRSVESARQYATELTHVHSSLFKLAAKIQPCC